MSVAEWQASLYKAPKYGNESILCDGLRFDSKLERDRYLELKVLQHLGAVRWFTRQVPFYLPGNIIYRADFLVHWDLHAAPRHKGDTEVVTVEDCKGFLTRVSINKIKQVEAIYGFKVEIITKKKGKSRCAPAARNAKTRRRPSSRKSTGSTNSHPSPPAAPSTP